MKNGSITKTKLKMCKNLKHIYLLTVKLYYDMKICGDIENGFIR